MGLPVAKPDASGWVEDVVWSYPMVLQVGRANDYLRQLLLGDALETATGYTGALVEPQQGWRAIPTEPIPARAVRLSRHEVYSIAENADGFDVLVAELNAGKYPELAALLDAREAEANPHSPKAEVPQHETRLLERAARLADIVAEIEARARERGYPFDRAQWPGTKREFREFLEWFDARLAFTLPADDGNLNDELRPHGVKFASPGRSREKGLRCYRILFPDYPA